MNLAEASLKHVNTSRPQLIHSTSKQSVTASDDYYSLASDHSSNEDRGNGDRFETPPLRMRPQSPAQNDVPSQSEATIPPLRPVKHTQQGSDTSDDRGSAGAPTAGAHQIPRKPMSTSSQSTIRERPLSESSLPTPDVDDTPYIHYAIDSLTRDERSYYALDDSSRENMTTLPQPIAHDNISFEQAPSQPSSRHSRASLASHILLPTTPIGTEAFRYPRLNFVPRSLRIIPLTILVLLCLLMMAALLFCAVWPTGHFGLFSYDGTGTSRYFLFQYLPQILAFVIILWLFIIQSALHRVFPFVSLASGSDERTSGVLHGASLFPTNYLTPNLAYFRYREPALGVCSIIFWLTLFTVPLQSSLFQTRYFLPEGTWIWTTLRPVAWTLFAIYLLLVIALILLLLRFVLYESGLKWDPVSLADVMVIFQHSNILYEFETSEIDASALRRQRPKSLRLGYWKTSRRDSETFYCIGDENAPVHRFSLERGRMQPVQDPGAWLPAEGHQQPKSLTVDTLQSEIYDPARRYRWAPWFLQDTFVVLWAVVAIVLLLAFIIVSFVNQAVQKGFLPLLPAPTSTEGFSPANFLYSFLPSLLGMFLFLLWQPIDQYFRALQPFANLSRRIGSPAERSLLLDYNACLPFEITLKALGARHYKVAWISFTALYTATIPVLAGGVFTAQFNVPTQSVRMAASMPGYIGLVVFTALSALSFLAIWPTRARRLPHDISSLGQLVSFFYRSPLLADRAFREPRGKIDLVTRLIATPIGERALPRYMFGVYRGVDGREHLGIDRFERPVAAAAAATATAPPVTTEKTRP